jgi:hypothetical protein
VDIFWTRLARTLTHFRSSQESIPCAASTIGFSQIAFHFGFITVWKETRPMSLQFSMHARILQRLKGEKGSKSVDRAGGSRHAEGFLRHRRLPPVAHAYC